MKKQAAKKSTGLKVADDTEIQTDLFANPDIAPDLATNLKAAVKPRKKNAVAAADAPPHLSVEGESEEAETVPALKAAKKAAAKSKAVKTTALEVEQPAENTVEAEKPAAKKKPAKAKKGRDLVVDVPGAVEVADVLGVNEPRKDAIEEDRTTAGAGPGNDLPELDADDAGDLDNESESRAARPEPKLERLQKILAKSGISSRRKAEELILGGRVQINGKVILELGTKADMARDHVRVDGKLLQGAERIRYFVLNKPKGFVTTVSDPEGRPTVMQFFSAEQERLYPVGRLDYLSEGLLLITNDGELANKLTKAASGVEKTYLVKVAGQPTEDMLDVLRQGVVIERGRPGTNSGRVRTAPAKIRQVRQGDNPWYEVIVIEGRNRELRKMFEEIGHHVEKIRRIGYGPLVLDLEPGKLRELEPEEVTALRLTADGKLKPKKRKGPAQAQLPTVAGKTVRYKKADGKPGYEPKRAGGAREAKVRPEFQQESKSDAPPSMRLADRAGVRAGTRSGVRPAFRPDSRAEGKGLAHPRPEFRKERKPAPRAEFPAAGRQGVRPAGGTSFKSGPRPDSSRGDSQKAGGRADFGGKPRRNEPPVTEFVLPPRKAMTPGEFDEKPRSEFNPDFRPGFRTGDKPAFRSEGRPGGKAPFQRGGGKKSGSDRAARPGSDRFDETGASTAPPFSSTQDKGGYDQGVSGRPAGRGKPAVYREDYPDSPPEKRVKIGIEPVVERAREERPRGGARAGFDRAGEGKPFRPAAGVPPYRADGDRPGPGGKPFRPRADGPSDGEREFRPRPTRPTGGRGLAGTGGSGSRNSGPRSAGTGSAGSRPGVARPAGRPDGPGREPGRPRFDSRSNEAGGSERQRSSTSKPGSRFNAGGARKFGPKPGGPRPGGARPAGARPGAQKPGIAGASRAASEGAPSSGAPVKKERWRNSFTGKNKGRPKPKAKRDE